MRIEELDRMIATLAAVDSHPGCEDYYHGACGCEADVRVMSREVLSQLREWREHVVSSEHVSLRVVGLHVAAEFDGGEVVARYPEGHFVPERMAAILAPDALIVASGPGNEPGSDPAEEGEEDSDL